MSKRLFAIYVLGSVICLFAARAESQAFALSADPLGKLNLSFPSYMSTLEEFSRYQARLSTHQTLFLRFDLAGGGRKYVKREDAESGGSPALSGLVLKKRISGQSGGPGFVNKDLTSDEVLAVGVSTDSEVRCLKSFVDPRIIRSEAFSPKVSREESLAASADFDLQFCDDPQIHEIRLFRVDSSQRAHSLKEIAKLVVER